MNILVLGANGQLGRAVVARLAGDSHRVRAFMRHPDASTGRPNIELFRGDATDETAAVAASRGEDACC